MLKQITLKNLTDEFLEDRRTSGKSPKTISFYSQKLNHFLLWLESENLQVKFVDDVTTPLLKNYFADYGLSHSHGGLMCAYRSIRALFNYYDWTYEPENYKNPMRKIKIQARKNPPLPEIPLNKIQALLNETKHTTQPERDRAILLTMVDTGVRVSELMALNIKDLDLSTGSIKILSGKGFKFRTVFVGGNGIKSIKKYLSTRENYQPDEPLFLTDEFKRLQYEGIRQLLERLSNRANIPYFSPHSYRRTCGLTLYKKLRDVYFVSNYLGHENISTTRVYLNLTAEDLREEYKNNSPADMLE